MTENATSVKKYVVRLTVEERQHLDNLIHTGKRSAQQVTKARILLKADISDAGEGWSDSQIVEALDTSLATVCRTRQQFVEEGLEAVLTRKQRATSQGRPVLYTRLYFMITQTPFMAQTEATSCRLSQKPCWMLPIPFARPRLRAKLLRRAAMPGLTRILLASSPMEPSRTRWL